MKTNVYDLNGSVVRQVELPKVFSTPVREDLIRRAVLAARANSRQPYAADKLAGKRTSAHYHGVKDTRGSMKNREMARLPRLHGKTVPYMFWRARFAPHTVGGREAHPPKAEKNWSQKINKKEKRLALVSAIAAARSMVIVDDVEKISKTKELEKVLSTLKIDLERVGKRKIRPGKGKVRGRKYRRKKSVLIVVLKYDGIRNAGRNLHGVNITSVNELNVEMLAPGAVAGRKVLWSEATLKKIGETFG